MIGLSTLFHGCFCRIYRTLLEIQEILPFQWICFLIQRVCWRFMSSRQGFPTNKNPLFFCVCWKNLSHSGIQPVPKKSLPNHSKSARLESWKAWICLNYFQHFFPTTLWKFNIGYHKLTFCKRQFHFKTYNFGYLYQIYRYNFKGVNIESRISWKVTLPETNSHFAPENRPGPKRKRSYSKHPFSGAMLLC